MRGPWLALLALVVSVSAADDRRSDPTRLTVMTLNAEFLWDGVEPEEGTADFEWKGSQIEADEHMRQIAEIIMRADPDIVNLVEVEGLDALNRLNTAFLPGRGYRAYFAQGRDTSTGQDVAMLSRIDPRGNAIVYDDREGRSGERKKRVTKNYVAEFDVGGRKIAIIGLHFLAFPLHEGRRIDRQAQADAIRQMAVERAGAGFQVIVLGDFNDYESDDAGRDHIDSIPVSTVLRDVRLMDPDKADDNLTNAASLLPKAVRFTALHDANDNGRADPPFEFTSIDHVLVSPGLMQNLVAVDIPHEHEPPAVTDHFPIVVTFSTGTPGPGANVARRLRVTALVPNPPGDEDRNETATLVNPGTASVNLAGWKLRDLTGRAWALDALGSLAAGQSKEFRRNGQPMALNNGGDTIDLLDPQGTVVQTITYGPVDESEQVLPPAT